MSLYVRLTVRRRKNLRLIDRHSVSANKSDKEREGHGGHVATFRARADSAEADIV